MKARKERKRAKKMARATQSAVAVDAREEVRVLIGGGVYKWVLCQTSWRCFILDVIGSDQIRLKLELAARSYSGATQRLSSRRLHLQKLIENEEAVIISQCPFDSTPPN